MNSAAMTKYVEAKTGMLLYCPFFAALLLDMMTVKVGKFPEVFGGKEPTAATDGKTVWFDEDFILPIAFVHLMVEWTGIPDIWQ